MEERLQMQNKVEKATRNYTKETGTIQVNKGEQSMQVCSLLIQHGYETKDVSHKKSRSTIMYMKKGEQNDEKR